MRYLASFVLLLSWALWIGGIVAVLIGVTALFDRFHPDRALAGRAAAAIFVRFGFYELGVAGVALVAAVVVRLTRPSRPRTAAFVLLALSAVAAVITTGYVTPAIEAMRTTGETQTDAFKSLHGLSMILFAGRTLTLLAAGALLPAAILKSPQRVEGVATPSV